MASTERKVDGTEDSRRTIFIVVGLASAILVAGFLYWMTRPGANTSSGPQRLEGALRAGAPEFEQLKSKITLDKPEATEATRPIGDIIMTLQTTVRNFTGRTLTGLEIYAAVVDLQGNSVKERTVIVLPSRRPGGPAELEPNQTMVVPIVIDGMSKEADRANIKMEVAAIRVR
jgi:hypothetical protein